MMKLKVLRVFEAQPVLAAIIAAKRSLPAKGTYRIVRMNTALTPEWQMIAERHNALVLAYNHKRKRSVPAPKTKDDPLGQTMVEIEEDAVPDDKMLEFEAAWKEISAEEIEVAVEPIPLDHLTFPDGESMLSYAEFAALGELVAG